MRGTGWNDARRAGRTAERAADLMASGTDPRPDADVRRRTTVEHRSHDAVLILIHEPGFPFSPLMILERPTGPDDLRNGLPDDHAIENALRDAAEALLTGRRSAIRPSRPQELAELAAPHCFHLGPDEVVVRPPFGGCPASIWLRSGTTVPSHLHRMIADCTPAVRMDIVRRGRRERLGRAEITIRIEPVLGRASTTVDPLAYMRMLADGPTNGASRDAHERGITGCPEAGSDGGASSI
jgi:hypothetical protein